METVATRQLTGDLPAISLALRTSARLNVARPKAADLKNRSALLAVYVGRPWRRIHADCCMRHPRLGTSPHRSPLPCSGEKNLGGGQAFWGRTFIPER